MMRAVGGLSLLLTLLPPRVSTSQPVLQPPVTPACVSSPFGWRHAVGPHAPAGFHNGIDLPAPAGALVHAAAAGTVEMVKRQGLGGVTVHLRHPGGLVTLYAHLGNLMPAIAEGRRKVAAGAVLGPEPGQANRKERIGRPIRTQRTNRGIGVILLPARLSWQSD